MSAVKSLNVEQIENYLLDAMEKWNVPGLSIAIVKNGETVLAKGYGTREIDKNLPVDEHTLFSISGTTASFTASALALLISEGKMNWSDRLLDLLPNFRTGNDLVTNHATVIDALANRTCLAGELLSLFPHPDLSRTDILGRMKYIESANDFRSCWGINFHMTMAAGEIIPSLTGSSWDDFVSDRLFVPLGMTDSVTGPHLLSSITNVVTPHDRDALTVTPIPHPQTANIGPAVSIYSSAADMARWLKFQLSGGKVVGKIIIPESEIEMMRSSYVPANFSFPGISKNFIDQGLGLFISDNSMGYKVYSNGGDIDGMEAYHAFVPELDLGIAIMVNSIIAVPQPLIAWIIDRYSEAPYEDWVNTTLTASVEHSKLALSKVEDFRQLITDQSKKPSHDLNCYAGIYRHTLLGDLTVQATSEALSFKLGTDYKGDFFHANHNTFFIKATTHRYSRMLLNGPAQFRIDHRGRVDSLLVAGKEFQKNHAEE